MKKLTISLTVALAALLLTAWISAESAPKRPNILFAIADDWGWPHAGAYSDPVVKTPTLAVLLHDPTPPAETGSSYDVQGRGLRLKTAGVRKVPPECFEPRVKSLNYLNNVLARIEAIESGHDEAILLDTRGFVAEAAGENIFIVREGIIRTPLETGILDGITRRTVLETADWEGIPAEEADLTLYDLYTADEAFLTSSFSRVHGVAEVDGRLIPCPGPITLDLQGHIAELERTTGETID